MPKRDLYGILGVPADSNAQTIKHAYRRLALKVHPDSEGEPDPARFREVHDAYLVLSDQDRRRTYDIEIGVRRRNRMPVEDITTRRSVSIPDDFQSASPSIGELLDHIAQNFFGFHRKSGGPYRHLGIEIVLSHDEAVMGCRLPIDLPSYEPCPRCEGHAWMWGLCPLCHGYGLVESQARVTLEIPSRVHSGAQYEIALDRVGIGNLILDVTVLVA